VIFDRTPVVAQPLEAVPPAPAAGDPLRMFPPPPARRERWPRRVRAAAATVYHRAEAGLDRVVSPALNPLYHSGTIAMFSLAVATVTGLYLFVFYRVGTEAAHRSVEGIMAHPLGIGALMRSLHRYASDAAVLAAALHGLKMLLDDRFWGARWVAWVSGLALLGLVWVTGATGYWLVWDLQAQVLSVATAKLLDVLPIFGEPLVRTFVDSARIQNFLFFLVLFVHISIPFLLGAMYWLHVMRLSRARFLPPRVVLGVTGAALVAASLVRPAVSGPPADLARLPGIVAIDWFYFAYFPLTTLDPKAGWALAGGGALALLVLPWVLRGPAPARARVENAACTGCTRCWKDCPYGAIAMVPRSDGTRYKLVAVVNPARCVGCGICVGACDSAGIVLADQPVAVLGEAVTARIRALAATGEAAPVVIYACRLMAHLGDLVGPDGTLAGAPGTVVMGLPCAGLLHPEMIAKTLAAGARGVFVAACVSENCPAREGSQWLAERLAGLRQPAARGLPAGRVAMRGYAPVDVQRFRRDLAAFRAGLEP
jgi:Pyruvate/2-oxoacid:ferredoxin oxidoreductase delta subunit/coenzyme F420-reducing hydrogenase delta subunit